MTHGRKLAAIIYAEHIHARYQDGQTTQIQQGVHERRVLGNVFSESLLKCSAPTVLHVNIAVENEARCDPVTAEQRSLAIDRSVQIY